jgi:hypothetical protein
MSSEYAMNGIWGNVLVGAASGILGTLAAGAIGKLGPLGSHLVFPPDAVIAMAGACPPGWHRYDAASGRYIVGADGRNFEAGTMGQASGATVEYREEDLNGKGDIIITAPKRQSLQAGPHGGSLLVSPDVPSSYIALSLCQRR